MRGAVMKLSFRGAPPGFTLAELLFGMAMLVITMAVLSPAFTRGLETFRQLNTGKDLDETVLHDAQELVSLVEAVQAETQAFIAAGLQTGAVDHQHATTLRLQYESIRAAAADLLVRLQAFEPTVTRLPARLALHRAIASLAHLRTSAALTIEILAILESGGFSR